MYLEDVLFMMWLGYDKVPQPVSPQEVVVWFVKNDIKKIEDVDTATKPNYWSQPTFDMVKEGFKEHWGKLSNEETTEAISRAILDMVPRGKDLEEEKKAFNKAFSEFGLKPRSVIT